MRRFPVDLLPDQPSQLLLGADHYRHIVRVLRMRVGEPLLLFDIGGRQTRAVIRSIGNEELWVETEAPVEMPTPTKRRIHLALAMPKGKKIDLVLQKATELGVNSFFLFPSKRSVSRPDEERIERKIPRWKKIISEAARQCCRGEVPEIKYESSMQTAMASMQDGTRLVLALNARSLIADFLDPAYSEITLMVGPEGGFTDDEIETAAQSGFVPVRFGGLVLRAETAAIAAVAPFAMDMGEEE